jgi:hypothetical protein
MGNKDKANSSKAIGFALKQPLKGSTKLIPLSARI